MRPKVTLVAFGAVSLGLAALKMTDGHNESGQTQSSSHSNFAPNAAPSPATTAILTEDSLPVEPKLVVERMDPLSASYSYPLSSAEETHEPSDKRTAAVVRGAVQALPGFDEFAIPSVVAQATELRDEADKPMWSRPMEQRILSEVAEKLDSTLVESHAVCRSSICGLVYVYDHKADSKPGMYSCLFYSPPCVQLGQELGDELGFNSLHGGFIVQDVGIGFTFIYLGN